MLKRLILFAIVCAALLIQGCGGGGGSSPVTSTGPAGPTAKTKADVAQQLTGYSQQLVGMSFTTFSPGTKSPTQSGPYYSTLLSLWVQPSVSSTTFTETFYQDQAETEPAGSATYTLTLSTATLSGAMLITAGPYAGLSGTYSQTLSLTGTTGNYAFVLPSGTKVTCTFTVNISAGGVPTGTANQTVTLTNGYSEKSTTTYNSDGSFKIVASDSNGYTSTFNFSSDLSGTGTINGPDPGLPATVVWNSVGTGTVTFANGLVVNFTNWQFPTN